MPRVLRPAGDADLESDLLTKLDFEPIHPLTGHVYVRGVEEGSALEIEILELRHMGWGWNGIVPGFGLLAEDFAEPYLHHWLLKGKSYYFRDDFTDRITF